MARVFVSSFWDEAYRFRDRRAPGGTSVLHRDTLGVIGSSNTWVVGVDKNILPSGNFTGCYWKWPFIAPLTIKMSIFYSYVSLPEGGTRWCKKSMKQLVQRDGTVVFFHGLYGLTIWKIGSMVCGKANVINHTPSPVVVYEIGYASRNGMIYHCPQMLGSWVCSLLTLPHYREREGERNPTIIIIIIHMYR